MVVFIVFVFQVSFHIMKMQIQHTWTITESKGTERAGRTGRNYRSLREKDIKMRK